MWEKNLNLGNPHNWVGTENPIHMQGSCPEVGFEPGSTEVEGRERNPIANLVPHFTVSIEETKNLNSGKNSQGKALRKTSFFFN